MTFGVYPSPGTTISVFGGSRVNAFSLSGPLPIRGMNEPTWTTTVTESYNTGVTGIDDQVVYNTPVFEATAPIGWTGRFPSGGTVTVLSQDDTPTTTSESGSTTVPPVKLNLLENVTDIVAPGSVRFEFNGRTYVDRAGDLVYNPAATTNAGNIGGTINYTNGTVELTDWTAGDFSLNVVGLGSIASFSPTNRLFFRTPAAPIIQGSLTVSANSYDDGTLLTATAANDGEIDATNIRGFIDYETGVVEVFFGQWVTAAGNEGEWWYNADAVVGGQIFRPKMIIPGSATFSAVAVQSIPLDPGILGLDPILLPSTGRVPIFGAGDSLMIVQRAVVEESSPTAGGTTDTGINNVQWVRVRDDNGEDVLSEHYTLDADTGVITWANPLDLAAYTGPYSVEVLSYFKRLCTDVQVNGQISLASGAPFDMANADGQIFLCSKLVFQPDGGNQDLQAIARNLFTQLTWTSVWSDSQIGSGTTGQFDDVNFPIEMTNNGSITERWRLEFTSTTTVNVIGERFGQVLTDAPIGNDIAPVNPATSTPYFTIKAGGWSGGWQIGNVVRFNTVGANDPVWIIRSTQPGDAPDLPTDRFIAHLQGDTAQE